MVFPLKANEDPLFTHCSPTLNPTVRTTAQHHVTSQHVSVLRKYRGGFLFWGMITTVSFSTSVIILLLRVTCNFSKIQQLQIQIVSPLSYLPMLSTGYIKCKKNTLPNSGFAHIWPKGTTSAQCTTSTDRLLCNLHQATRIKVGSSFTSQYGILYFKHFSSL